MANQPRPFTIAITDQGTRIIASCRDGSGTLIAGDYQVVVNAAFDNQASPHSLAGAAADIILGGTGSGTITVTGPKGWKNINLNCRTDDSIISTSTDPNGVKLAGPYVIGINQAFAAGSPHVLTAGEAKIGDSFGTSSSWPPNVVSTLAAGSTPAQLQAALNAASAGQSVVCAGGTYALTSNIAIPNGVHLHASASTTMTGNFSLGTAGGSGWTITSPDNGDGANTGFLFDGPWINADNTTGVVVTNNRFQNQASRYNQGQGSCVSVTGSNGTIIANNDFSGNIAGVTIGIYGGPNNLVIDGNHFTDGLAEPISLKNSADTSRGMSLKVLRNNATGLRTPFLEVGPTEGTVLECFANATISNNRVVDWAGGMTDGGKLLAYSFVALAPQSSVVCENNYARRGVNNNGFGPFITCIEVTTGTAHNNVTDGWVYTISSYNGGNVVTGNSAYVSGATPQWGPGSGSHAGTGVFTPNTVLGSPPADPGVPARIASSTYYPV